MGCRARLWGRTVAVVAVFAVAGCSAVEGGDADAKPSGSVSASPRVSASAGGSDGGVKLADAIAKLPVAAEYTGKYSRSDFKHWNGGLDSGDGCDTREELLVAEAVKAPTKGEGCKLSGGEWLSYYDEVTVTDAGGLDVDHMVPLEEAWGSGAYEWDAARREAYANDLEAPRSLVAVTAKTNRSKGAKDPAQWLPPAESVLCTYLEDWTATKLRWRLSIDETERDALVRLAEGCPDSTLTYEPAA